MTWREDHPDACYRCLGCGLLANTDDREPWSAWADLPPGSDLAVRMGMVQPEPCDECGGTGVAQAIEPTNILPERKPAPERDVYTFDALGTTGVLWLINRAVFHPRGLALALEYADGEAEPRGWSLLASDKGEPFCFGLPDGKENELYREVERLIRETKRLGSMPPRDAK